MRTNHNHGDISNTILMEAVSKNPKPKNPKHSDVQRTRDSKPISKGRRYSVDVVSSKPIISFVRSNKTSISKRRLSIGNSKAESDGSTDDKQSEVRSILKSGLSASKSPSIQPPGTESSVSEDNKGATDVKCSYRLPKTKEPSKLRKCVSFKEEELSESVSRRRYSSPTLDVSTNYLIPA